MANSSITITQKNRATPESSPNNTFYKDGKIAVYFILTLFISVSPSVRFSFSKYTPLDNPLICICW